MKKWSFVAWTEDKEVSRNAIAAAAEYSVTELQRNVTPSARLVEAEAEVSDIRQHKDWVLWIRERANGDPGKMQWIFAHTNSTYYSKDYLVQVAGAPTFQPPFDPNSNDFHARFSRYLKAKYADLYEGRFSRNAFSRSSEMHRG